MDPKNGPRFLTEEVIFPAVRDSYQDLVRAVDVLTLDEPAVALFVALLKDPLRADLACQ